MGANQPRSEFGQRLNRTALGEFLRTAFWTKSYESAEQLQADLDEWLAYYNHGRPHQGSRNIGRRSFDTIDIFLGGRGTEAELDLATVRYDA